MSVLVLVLVAFFVAGLVHGFLGFGFATATTLVLVHSMDFTFLVFLNLCMSVLTSLFALSSRSNLQCVERPILGRLMASALLGLLIGLVAIQHTNETALKQVTLAVILLASLLSLTKTRAFFARPGMVWVSGFFSGVLTPSTGINGPLVALYLNAAMPDKEIIRSTMLSYIFLIMLFGVLSLLYRSGLPKDTLALIGKVAVPSVGGYFLGMTAFRHVSHGTYQKVVTAFLILSSVLSLIYQFI